MSSYRHTQVGAPFVAAGVIGGVVLVGLVVASRGHPGTLIVLALFTLVLVMFHSLTVEVTNREVRVRFGSGPFGKRFSTPEIERVTVVRNHWWYGWGIRWFGRGWLYNISGLDAVELAMRNGRVYRIGTDEPRELQAAIERAREGGASG